MHGTPEAYSSLHIFARVLDRLSRDAMSANLEKCLQHSPSQQDKRVPRGDREGGPQHHIFSHIFPPLIHK